MVTKSDIMPVAVLSERYMTLKVQADKIKTEMDEVTTKLLLQMKAGDKVETPEYSVQVLPGRSTVYWTDKDQKKLFEEELIKKGLMDIKIGKPYITGRFVKNQAGE